VWRCRERCPLPESPRASVSSAPHCKPRERGTRSAWRGQRRESRAVARALETDDAAPRWRRDARGAPPLWSAAHPQTGTWSRAMGPPQPTPGGGKVPQAPRPAQAGRAVPSPAGRRRRGARSRRCPAARRNEPAFAPNRPRTQRRARSLGRWPLSKTSARGHSAHQDGRRRKKLTRRGGVSSPLRAGRRQRPRASATIDAGHGSQVALSRRLPTC